VINGGRFRLKTKHSVRLSVSTGIVLQNKIDCQMPSAIKTAERDAIESSRVAGIAVSKLVRSTVLVGTRKAVHLGRKF
jgi:hypothetical protein